MSYRRQDVIERAVDVLDEVGLESLSMRRLGAELGVQPSALYHHVADKQTLLGLMADEILARGRRDRRDLRGREACEPADRPRQDREVAGARDTGDAADRPRQDREVAEARDTGDAADRPREDREVAEARDTGDTADRAATAGSGEPAWDARVAGVCGGLRAAMLACRDGAEVVATGYAFGYGADAPADELRQVLAEAGFSDSLVGVGTSTLLHYVFGHTTEEQTTLQADALGAKRAPRAASDFGQGLALIIDGLRARH